eukprot:COSAG06_NODE_10752_length_1623_cov_1.622047_1_plen_389_part_01
MSQTLMKQESPDLEGSPDDEAPLNNIKQLRERAADLGVDRDRIEAARDGDDPMNDMIALIRDKTTGAARSSLLARDSDAAESVFYPEQKKVGALLANSEGGPSPLCYAVQAACVGLGVSNAHNVPYSYAPIAGMAEPSDLLYLSGLFPALGWVAFIFVISSTRVALRMPGGKLDELGVETVKISAKEAKSNARWRKGLLVLSTLSVLWGIQYILCAIAPELWQVDTYKTMEWRINNVLNGLNCCTTWPMAISGWWASMRTASCLCRDEVVEIIRNIRSIDPKEKVQWEEKVARPTFALSKKFEQLSDGWSSGLLGVSAGCWLFALMLFTAVINTPVLEGLDAANGQVPGTQRKRVFLGAVIFVLLPFPLAADLASTSTHCDYLMDELNE